MVFRVRHIGFDRRTCHLLRGGVNVGIKPSRNRAVHRTAQSSRLCTAADADGSAEHIGVDLHHHGVLLRNPAGRRDAVDRDAARLVLLRNDPQSVCRSFDQCAVNILRLG